GALLSTPFPYTTLFRSAARGSPPDRPLVRASRGGGAGDDGRDPSRRAPPALAIPETRRMSIIRAGALDRRVLIERPVTTVTPEGDRKSTRLNSSHVKIS